MRVEEHLGRPRGLPVTILTGFLGSGKTTLLNHILREDHGLRVAVIVNEFGEISIDNQLVIGVDESGDVIELSNGCICCSVRTDLYDAVMRLLKRGADVDTIIIETTGLADPQPIAQTFFLPDLQEKTYLDSIVAVVDTTEFDRALAESATAEAQVSFADFVLLNKADDAGAERVAAAEKRVRDLNPFARVLACNHGRVDLRLLLDVGAFDLARRFDPAEANAFLSGASLAAHDATHEGDACGDDHDHAEHGHIQADGFQAASYAFDAPFVAQAFQDFLEALPTSVFRSKGILWFLGEKQRAVFNQVGSAVLVEWGCAWGARAPRSEIVFIGKGVDKQALGERLAQCLAPSRART